MIRARDIDAAKAAIRLAASKMATALPYSTGLERDRDIIKTLADELNYQVSLLCDACGADGSHVVRDIQSDAIDDAFAAAIDARDSEAETRANRKATVPYGVAYDRARGM